MLSSYIRAVHPERRAAPNTRRSSGQVLLSLMPLTQSEYRPVGTSAASGIGTCGTRRKGKQVCGGVANTSGMEEILLAESPLGDCNVLMGAENAPLKKDSQKGVSSPQRAGVSTVNLMRPSYGGSVSPAQSVRYGFPLLNQYTAVQCRCRHHSE